MNDPWDKIGVQISNVITSSDVFGDGYADTSTVNMVNEITAMQQSAVYACCTLIARAMATMPIQENIIDDLGFKTPKRGSKLWTIFNVKANPWQSSYEFREMLAYQLTLRGVAYARVFRNVRGDVTSLVPLHPDNVSAEFNTSGTSIIYTVTDPVKQTSYTLAQKDVLHIRGLYSDLVTPISPIEYARRTISSDISLSEHQDSSFGKNSIRAGGILSTDKAIKKEAVTNIEKRMNDRFAGISNAHKTMVLDNGLKFTPLRISNSDAQFLETRRFSVEEICRIFGVPPELIQQTVDSSYNQAEQQHLSFITFTLLPSAQRFESAILAQLVPDNKQSSVEYDHDFWDLSKGDMDTVSDYLRGFVQGGIMTPNEARARLNLPKNSDEGADKLYIQQNMASVDNLENLQNGGSDATREQGDMGEDQSSGE